MICNIYLWYLFAASKLLNVAFVAQLLGRTVYRYKRMGILRNGINKSTCPIGSSSINLDHGRFEGLRSECDEYLPFFPLVRGKSPFVLVFINFPPSTICPGRVVENLLYYCKFSVSVYISSIFNS